MTVLDVLADHLDAFELDEFERAYIFHAYDLAPDTGTFDPRHALDYVRTPAQAAWRRARQIRLVRNGESFGMTLMFHVPNAYGATKMDILSGLAKARGVSA